MTRLEYRCSVKSESTDGAINTIAIDRILPETKEPQGLSISFERTIRVPDNKKFHDLPPSFGAFPLYKVDEYASRLPQSMVDKGGIFFPMHQKEAMWISFRASAPFMIKIYCGGVNVVSGEHATEGNETRNRRSKLRDQGKLIQDYVVVPDQLWLDGVAIEPSVVRQFVAMPTGQGYTVEAQVTGKEAVGGLLFEITPALCQIKEQPHLKIHVKTLTGRSITVGCSEDDDIRDIKDRLRDELGYEPDKMRLIYGGRQLEDGKTLSDYNIQQGAVLHLVLRIRGGGPWAGALGIAAGGLIKQNIRKDTRDPQKWARGLTIPIPVQILNSLDFRRFTALDPPASPIDAKLYTEIGLPFFDLHEENTTDVSGAEAFGTLQSINEIDTAQGKADGPEPAIHPRVIRLREEGTGITAHGDAFRIEDPDGLVSPSGPRRDFRALADLEAEIRDFKLDS